MGRPSVLSDPQREEIGRRLAGGETLRGLSRTFILAETGDRSMELEPRYEAECQGYIRNYIKEQAT